MRVKCLFYDPSIEMIHAAESEPLFDDSLIERAEIKPIPLPFYNDLCESGLELIVKAGTESLPN